MWSRLRVEQFLGLKFRRQHGIGPYIVDFYCPAAGAVIEIDGDIHAIGDRPKKDLEREKHISELGLKIIRYSNADVLKNIEGVLLDLVEKIGSAARLPRVAKEANNHV